MVAVDRRSSYQSNPALGLYLSVHGKVSFAGLRTHAAGTERMADRIRNDDAFATASRTSPCCRMWLIDSRSPGSLERMHAGLLSQFPSDVRRHVR